ncbi:MAG TPA: DUF1835 domain-containing protein [Mucilaginibacter sp.]|jgi:hypothetical protein|nr:DUF1835 domain-containing protein [Mucilaginibacter sp.]
MNILHILNGDSTRYSFEQTGLAGDTVVWHEVLSEGPVQEDISSGSFWKARSEWISESFHETPENYQAKMLATLSTLSEPYDEINLWFEFDLHCQVNLIGAMTYMQQKTDLSAPAIYLICPADYPGKENFMGMGELTGEELEYLYDNIRVRLSETDFVIASEAWDVYVTRDVDKLKAYLAETDFWGNLHLLKPALEAHLRRLQVNEHGLNYIEQKLLEIYNYGIKTKPEIYLRFWSTEKIYGLGDAEIDIYLNRLKEKGLINF